MATRPVLAVIDHCLQCLDSLGSVAVDQPYSKGLAGVIAAESEICTVGKRGLGLLYRGYSIEDLSAHCRFEEIAYLLTRHKLPTAKELSHYLSRLSSFYALPPVITQILESTPKSTHPIDVIKVTVTILGALFPESTNFGDKTRVFDRDETVTVSDRILAAIPSAICYHHQFHHSNKRIATAAVHDREGIAEHILRLLHGNEGLFQLKGHKQMIESVDTALTCYAEHGLAGMLSRHGHSRNVKTWFELKTSEYL